MLEKYQTTEQKILTLISDIDDRLSKVEQRLSGIPSPFKLSYKPPQGEYQDLPKVLDDLHNRLNMLECHCTDRGT